MSKSSIRRDIRKKQLLALTFPNGSMYQTSYIRILQYVKIPHPTKGLYRILWYRNQPQKQSLWTLFDKEGESNHILSQEMKRFRDQKHLKQTDDRRSMSKQLESKQNEGEEEKGQTFQIKGDQEVDSVEKFQYEKLNDTFNRNSKKAIKRSKIENKSDQRKVTRLQSIQKTKRQKCMLDKNVKNSSFKGLKSQKKSMNQSELSYCSQSKSKPLSRKSRQKSSASTFSKGISQLQQQNSYWKQQFKTGLKNLHRSQIPPELEQRNLTIVEQIKSKSATNIDRSQIESIKIIDRYKSNYFLSRNQKYALNNKLKIGCNYYYKTLYNDCSEDQAVWENFLNEKNPMILKERNRFKECLKNQKQINLRAEKNIKLKNNNESEFIELQFNDNNQSIKIKTSYTEILQSKKDPNKHGRQTYYRIIWFRDQPQCSSRWYKFKKQDHQTILLYRSKCRFKNLKHQLKYKALSTKQPEQKQPHDVYEISQPHNNHDMLKSEEGSNETKWTESQN